MSYIDFAFDNLEFISVGFALLTIMISLFASFFGYGEKSTLDGVAAKAFAGASIPLGFALIVCAFDASKLQHIGSFGIYILVAGLSVLYVAVQALMPSTSKNLISTSESEPVVSAPDPSNADYPSLETPNYPVAAEPDYAYSPKRRSPLDWLMGSVLRVKQ